jgi:8-oxo-dGTP pyrophosphatase MutT (NUDIX family)
MPTPQPAEPDQAPDHACAVITAADGRCLLQLRPADARHAASQLTCFGGRREPRESAELCLFRELDEELGWRPPACRPLCDLRVAGRWIARFFACAMPAGVRLATEPGHVALWVPPAALPGLPLSPWHDAVLRAVARGDATVDLPA